MNKKRGLISKSGEKMEKQLKPNKQGVVDSKTWCENISDSANSLGSLF